MKKTTRKSMSLHRETLRLLSVKEAQAVAGGLPITRKITECLGCVTVEWPCWPV